MPTPSTDSLTAAEARAIFGAWYFEWLRNEFGGWSLADAYYRWPDSKVDRSLKELSRGAESDEHMLAFVTYAMSLKLLGVTR